MAKIKNTVMEHPLEVSVPTQKGRKAPKQRRNGPQGAKGKRGDTRKQSDPKKIVKKKKKTVRKSNAMAAALTSNGRKRRKNRTAATPSTGIVGRMSLSRQTKGDDGDEAYTPPPSRSRAETDNAVQKVRRSQRERKVKNKKNLNIAKLARVGRAAKPSSKKQDNFWKKKKKDMYAYVVEMGDLSKYRMNPLYVY